MKFMNCSGRWLLLERRARMTNLFVNYCRSNYIMNFLTVMSYGRRRLCKRAFFNAKICLKVINLNGYILMRFLVIPIKMKYGVHGFTYLQCVS